jgi:hypothetical protein
VQADRTSPKPRGLGGLMETELQALFPAGLHA